MHAIAQHSAAAPVIDLTVHDADLKFSDDRYIKTIYIWYEHELPVKKSKSEDEDLEQIEACGHDFLNYLRNVRGINAENLDDYWYDRKLMPKTRDKMVEEYLEYRANNALKN